MQRKFSEGRNSDRSFILLFSWYFESFFSACNSCISLSGIIIKVMFSTFLVRVRSEEVISPFQSRWFWKRNCKKSSGGLISTAWRKQTYASVVLRRCLCSSFRFKKVMVEHFLFPPPSPVRLALLW